MKLKKVADIYEKIGITVAYPTRQQNKEFSQIVEDYLYRISMADKVVAITKDDGTFGEGAIYEIAFAKYLNKPIEILNTEQIFYL